MNNRLSIADLRTVRVSVNRQLPIGNRQFNWGDSVISIIMNSRLSIADCRLPISERCECPSIDNSIGGIL